jgi:hypothetical protein
MGGIQNFPVGTRIAQASNPHGVKGWVINPPYPVCFQMPIPGLQIPAEADLVWTLFDSTSVPTKNPWYGLIIVSS